MERSSSDFPSLFLPFKNLLRKIKELLQTLEPSEVLVLEMLLCQLEEPANIATKLKEVERMLEIKEKSEKSALTLTAKLNGSDQEPSKIQRLNSIPCHCDNKNIDTTHTETHHHPASEEIVRGLINCIIEDVITRVNDLEIDCTQPEIRVSPRRTVEIDIVSASPRSTPTSTPTTTTPCTPAVPVPTTAASSDPRVKESTSPQPPARGTSAPIAFR